jgi:hypothetical protein
VAAAHLTILKQIRSSASPKRGDVTQFRAS